MKKALGLFVTSKNLLKYNHFAVSVKFSFGTIRQPISPKEIFLPKDKLELRFSRSSGPGGQNVNKVNTKVEVRFNVDTAEWLAPQVKEKLKELQQNSINSEGDLIVTSQASRTQERNREDAYDKLKKMIWEASLTEKERKFLIPPETETMARKRVDSKRKRSEIKRTRSGKFD